MSIVKPSITRRLLKVSKNITAYVVNRHVAALIGASKAAAVAAHDAAAEENDIYRELVAAEGRTLRATSHADNVKAAVEAEIALLAAGKLDEVTA